MVEDGRAEKETRPRDLAAPVDQQLRALGDSLVDVAGDPVSMVRADEGPNLHAGLITRSDHHLRGGVLQPVQQSIRRRPHSNGYRAREAPLTGVSKS